MKKLLALMLAAALALSLVACGGGSGAGGNTPPISTTQPDNNASQSDNAVTPSESAEVIPDDTEEPVDTVEVTNIAFGETISLDFVEMTFEESGIEEDIRQSITTDIAVGTQTRVTGPQPEEGKQFLYLRGAIKNLDVNELPVYDFFAGNFKVGDYNFEVSANNCDIITANGERMSTIGPLTSGSFTIYAAIPNELADNYPTADFTFGFYDLFDNSELAANRAFSDNPIAECPYQYMITIK